MKHFRLTLVLIASVLGLTACGGSDGELPEAEPLTEFEKTIVGGWPELGDEGVTFLQGGYLIHDGEVGHWQYDETAKTLTTDIVNSQNKTLIWQVSMLKEGSMVGIQLWDGSTFSAKRNAIQAVRDILCSESRTWTRDQNYKFLTISFFSEYLNIDNGKIGKIKYYYENRKGGNKYLEDVDGKITLSEQADFSSITLVCEEYGDHIIHNPYSYDKVWFEFSDGRKYYPVTDGMSDLTDIKMSGDESKLVGRWICHEQMWDREEPGHQYSGDEYGMEFSNDYWGKMWAGKDELMEAMGSSTFVWWIKDGMLYEDERHYYILNLSDKEMTLEWRDYGNIYTCKFYKESSI